MIQQAREGLALFFGGAPPFIWMTQVRYPIRKAPPGLQNALNIDVGLLKSSTVSVKSMFIPGTMNYGQRPSRLEASRSTRSRGVQYATEAPSVRVPRFGFRSDPRT